jgi:hypothetical protein
MTNKRLILTIGGLLLGASQINAMTNFKRFAPVLVGAAAVAQTQVVKAADFTNFTMTTLPDVFYSDRLNEYHYGKVDVSGYSAKQLMLALRMGDAIIGRGLICSVPESAAESAKDEIDKQYELIREHGINGGYLFFDNLNNRAIKVNIHLKKYILTGAHNYEKANGSGTFKAAVKDLKEVADQEFKRCSSDPRERWGQYNAEHYQLPEDRKELAHYFDEGADICRGGGGYRELLGLK